MITITEIATAELSVSEHISSFRSTLLSSSENKREALEPQHQIAFEITDKLKHQIKTLVDNGTNAAIVIGLVDSNGTQFYGYGKTSNVTNATVVNENTIFDIGSITKTFTTTILADTVNGGVLKLKDPIENFLSFYN